MDVTVWESVKGYEGLYAVSNTGQVRSLFRYKKILKHNISRRGYASVELFKDGSSKRLLVHRLVADAFIPNPDNLPQINHIDENPLNNNVNNLEWCTAKHNANHGTRVERIRLNNDYSTDERKQIARMNGKTVSKPIIQITPVSRGVTIRYQSAKQASQMTGIDYAHICAVANGKRKTAGKCKWEFERG